MSSSKIQSSSDFVVGDKVRVVITRKERMPKDPEASLPFLEKGVVVGVTSRGVYVAVDTGHRPTSWEWFPLYNRHVKVSKRKK